MKKIISMILAVAVISASGTSALAAETKNRIDLKNDYKAASKIFVEETDFPDIKQSPSGFYAMELDTVDGKSPSACWAAGYNHGRYIQPGGAYHK